MNIGILGAGAMGLLYGAYLSEKNMVFLLCRGEEKINDINTHGVSVEEADGSVKVYHPEPVESGSDSLPFLDVLILFVKARESRIALEKNKHLVGENTILLTLQNGSGHEEILSEFAPLSQIGIGVSQDGSLLLSHHEVRHTGSGKTYFGLANGCQSPILGDFEKTCKECGFDGEESNKIKWFIYEKLMINASSSVMSGVLGKEQGFCYTEPLAWLLVQNLVQEIVQVAVADGIPLDYPTQIKRLEDHLTTNPQGIPSICVDLKEHRLTEVDTISGSVVRAGKRLGVPTPANDLMVRIVHQKEEMTG